MSFRAWSLQHIFCIFIMSSGFTPIAMIKYSDQKQFYFSSALQGMVYYFRQVTGQELETVGRMTSTVQSREK